jgi:hypothetical protein
VRLLPVIRRSAAEHGCRSAFDDARRCGVSGYGFALDKDAVLGDRPMVIISVPERQALSYRNNVGHLLALVVADTEPRRHPDGRDSS